MFYYIVTFGCQMNKSDSERIASFLEDNSYKETEDVAQADIIIVNTCGIRQAAENRAKSLTEGFRELNPKASLVVTGCLARREDVKKKWADSVDLFLPINELPNLLNILKEKKLIPSLSQDEVRALSGEKYLTIIPKYESSFTAYVPIGNGCNNFCSYCVVPYARGREVYRPAKDILEERRYLVEKGYKEIILIAQNVNSYKSEDIDFPQLLRKVSQIEGDFWIRFSSSHPKDLSDDLIKAVASSDKICRHLHVAVQSGNDEILKAMNRKYSSGHFKELIRKIREAKPGISITTDVIVGFPGESKEQFQDTVKLFEEVQFEMAYISRFSPRPGTMAAKMKDNVSSQEKKRRDQVLNDALKKSALKANKAYVGKEVRVLVEGKNKRGEYYGKTESFKNVNFKDEKKDKNLIGQFVNVIIESAQAFGLKGTLR